MRAVSNAGSLPGASQGRTGKALRLFKLDISRDEHAEELRERFQASADGGVPWYCILDGEAKVLKTSNVPTAKSRSGSPNMGFPTMPTEIEHFVGMLKATAPRLADEKLVELKAELLKTK